MIRRSNKLFVDEAARQAMDNRDLLHFERMIRQLYFKVVHTRMLPGSEAIAAPCWSATVPSLQLRMGFPVLN